MYIKFKFTKKSHVCWEKIIHAVLAPCERCLPLQTPQKQRPTPLRTPQKQCHTPLRTPLALANSPFTKYLDIHSFNSYTFDREQQKF